MTDPIPTLEERVAALEAAVQQLAAAQKNTMQVIQSLRTDGQALAESVRTLETDADVIKRRYGKLVILAKRLGPAVKDILGIIATQAANKDAQLPRDERKRRAKIREEVLGSDFNLDDSDGA